MIRGIVADRSVKLSLAAVPALAVATVFAPHYLIVVGALWAVWSAATAVAVARAARRTGAAR